MALVRPAFWFALSLASASASASASTAQPVSKDLQGQRNIAGTSNDQKPGPNYRTDSGSSLASLNNVKALSPPLSVSKVSAPASNLVNGTTSPKFIPGSGLDYTISVANSGSAITADSVVIIDPLPANLRLFVGNLGGDGPVVFADNAPSSGLTYSFVDLASTTDDIDFSNDNGATWTYVPTPDAGDGCDPAVNHIRIRPKGAMTVGGSFSLRFRAAIS